MKGKTMKKMIVCLLILALFSMPLYATKDMFQQVDAYPYSLEEELSIQGFFFSQYIYWSSPFFRQYYLEWVAQMILILRFLNTNTFFWSIPSPW